MKGSVLQAYGIAGLHVGRENSQKFEFQFFGKKLRFNFFENSSCPHARSSGQSVMRRLRLSTRCTCCGTRIMHNKTKVYYCGEGL